MALLSRGVQRHAPGRRCLHHLASRSQRLRQMYYAEASIGEAQKQRQRPMAGIRHETDRQDQYIILMSVFESLASGGLLPPKAVMFPTVLISSIQQVHGCLQAACDAIGYHVCFIFPSCSVLRAAAAFIMHHTAVCSCCNTPAAQFTKADAVQEACEYCFPIKCMHDSVMLATMLKHAHQDSFSWLMGFEVSTKAELLLVICLWNHLLSTSTAEKGGVKGRARITVICNGWKDGEYLELVDAALMAGIDAVVILENDWDVKFVVNTYSRLKSGPKQFLRPDRMLPALGLRVQLHEQHPGRWGSSSGKESKFGIRQCQLDGMLQLLHRHSLLNICTYMHFHMGSQVTDDNSLDAAMTEAACMCTRLRAQGVPVKTVDFGGGMPMDTTAPAPLSPALIQEYATTVVAAFSRHCEQAGAPQPRLVCESGGAVAASSAALILTAYPTGVSGQLHTNFSAFQSVPDAVLQHQRFAVLPLHTLESCTAQHGLPCMASGTVQLLDATCDSDGVLLASVICGCSKCSSKEHSRGSGKQAFDSSTHFKRDMVQAQDASENKGSMEHGTEAWNIEGSTIALAVLHTGAYQAALASQHNLFGQLETWYVMDSNVSLENITTDSELRWLQYDSEEACRHRAAEAGLELPDGWTKGRPVSVRLHSAVNQHQAFIAAVRPGESVSEVLHDVGISVQSHLGSRQTYCTGHNDSQT